MKVTVCELTNDSRAFPDAWTALLKHVRNERSDIVLLPEMPFYPWLAQTQAVEASAWNHAVRAHEEWISRLDEFGTAVVIGTHPVVNEGKRENAGFIRDPKLGFIKAHSKYYLPDEAGFWEATWYSRGRGDFKPVETSAAKIGFLICTELWFNQHAREYGKQGVQLLVCPRATPNPTADKWVAGGRAAAVVSGAYCLSSNLSGTTSAGCDFAGVGWIIEPSEGKALGLTSPDHPFLTLEVDLADADAAKKTYPRYVLD